MMLVRRAINMRLACQAMSIKVSANLVVQLIRIRSTTPLSPDEPPPRLDWQHVAEFAIYGFVGSQVGNIIQFILEDWFPTGGSSPAQGPSGDVLPRVIRRDEMGMEEKKVKMDDEKGHDDGSIEAGIGVGSGGLVAAGTPPRTGSKKWLNLDPNLSWRNVLAKLVLDQTIGLLITSTVFLTITNIARVPHPYLVFGIIRERMWPLVKAGWHLWPLVAMCNFLWVPVRSRVLVAVIVGFGWSIFLSIFSMRK